MANFDYAGVIVKEKLKKRETPVAGLAGVGAFIGVTEKGPKDTPIACSSYVEFKEKCGRKLANSDLHLTVYDFFQEGGKICYIINPSFADGATVNSVVLPRQYWDKVATGIIPRNRSLSITYPSGGPAQTFTKAQVLFNHVNSLVDSNVDYSVAGENPFGNTSISDLDVESVRIKIADTIVGVMDSDGAFTPVANYVAPSGERYTIGALTALNNISDADTALRMDETLMTVEIVDALGAAPTTALPVSFEYTLRNHDLHGKIAASTAVADSGSLTAGDTLSITFDFLTADYSLLSDGSDFLLRSMDLVDSGANHFSYNENLNQFEFWTGVVLQTLPIDVNSMVVGDNAGNVQLTLTLSADSDDGAAVALPAGTFVSAKVKVDVSSTSAFYEDYSVAYDDSGNTFHLINSKYAADVYNDYFMRLSTNDSYLDTYSATTYVDADVYTRQYASDGVTEITPLELENVQKLSFNSSDESYMFSLFNDSRLGSELLEVDDNSVTVDVPEVVATIPNGSLTGGYFYGNTVIGAIDALFADISLFTANPSFEILPGSVFIRKGEVNTGTTVTNPSVAVKVYRDNGIGGFYNADNPDEVLSSVSINYETGLLSGIDGETVYLHDASADAFIEVAFALTPLRTYVDLEVVDGVGGTENQNSYLSSSVLTDSILEDQGRGIYALTKIKGAVFAWGIPDLATSYGIAKSCMEFVDRLDVKSMIYVWNIDDNYTPETVNKYIRFTYTYRTKNALVAYPFKMVENVESDITRNGQKTEVAIPYIGAIVGRIAQRTGSATPHLTIAGKPAGKMVWGSEPTVFLSVKETGLLTDLIIPGMYNENLGFVLWGDGSLGDRSFDFTTVSDTLVFNTVEFELEAKLWEDIFKNIDEDLLTSIEAKITAYLTKKTQEGWFGTSDLREAFTVDMSMNNVSTMRNREVFVEVEISLPYSAKRVTITISRKS